MKRILCVSLVLVLVLLNAFCCTAATVDLSEEGKTVVEYGDWIIEKIDSDRYWELDSYIGSGGEIITPRFIDDMLVISFGDHCFANNTNVTGVITSSPLWTIGNYAFLNCTTIESFEFNFALHTIGIGAFAGTTSLTEINLEDSVVTAISDNAFADSGLTKVKLPETCTSIGEYAFVRCGDLAKITIPDSVTAIAETAFEGCDQLVIYAKSASYAIQYAVENGIDYVITDAPVEVTYMIGDADGDGVITILDATKIQRLLAALITDEDGMIALRGDCDGDGLNILDATKIQRHLVGFTTDVTIGVAVTVVI